MQKFIEKIKKFSSYVLVIFLFHNDVLTKSVKLCSKISAFGKNGQEMDVGTLR